MTRGRSLIYVPRLRPVCVREDRVPQIQLTPWLNSSTSGGTFAPAHSWVVQRWGYQWVDELAYRPDVNGD